MKFHFGTQLGLSRRIGGGQQPPHVSWRLPGTGPDWVLLQVWVFQASNAPRPRCVLRSHSCIAARTALPGAAQQPRCIGRRALYPVSWYQRPRASLSS